MHLESYIQGLAHTHNRLTAFGPGLPGWASTRRNTHPLTPILVIGHPLSTSSIYYDPWHPQCSVYVLDSPLWQPLSRSSLVFLFQGLNKISQYSYSVIYFFCIQKHFCKPKCTKTDLSLTQLSKHSCSEVSKSQVVFQRGHFVAAEEKRCKEKVMRGERLSISDI